jgi:hypothetical protein
MAESHLRSTSSVSLPDALSVKVVRQSHNTTSSGNELERVRIYSSAPIEGTTSEIGVHRSYYRYSLLIRPPTSGLLSSFALPKGAEIRIASTLPPTIRVYNHGAQSLVNLTQCNDEEFLSCTDLPKTQVYSVENDLLMLLFNRKKSHFSPYHLNNVSQAKQCPLSRTSVSALMWVTGRCKLSVNQKLGSPERPVLVVIENGDVIMPHKSRIYGLVILLNTDTQSPQTIAMAPDAYVAGALVLSASLHPKSKVNLVSSHLVIKRLQQRNELARVYPIEGSFRDF